MLPTQIEQGMTLSISTNSTTWEKVYVEAMSKGELWIRNLETGKARIIPIEGHAFRTDIELRKSVQFAIEDLLNMVNQELSEGSEAYSKGFISSAFERIELLRQDIRNATIANFG